MKVNIKMKKFTMLIKCNNRDSVEKRQLRFKSSKVYLITDI